MKNLKVGDCLQIQCYKHNKKVHRSWDEAVVLDIHDDYIVFGDNKTLVIVYNKSELRNMFFDNEFDSELIVRYLK